MNQYFSSLSLFEQDLCQPPFWVCYRVPGITYVQLSCWICDFLCWETDETATWSTATFLDEPLRCWFGPVGKRGGMPRDGMSMSLCESHESWFMKFMILRHFSQWIWDIAESHCIFWDKSCGVMTFVIGGPDRLRPTHDRQTIGH